MLTMCSNHEKIEEVSPNRDCGGERCWAEWENRAKHFVFIFPFFHLISFWVTIVILPTYCTLKGNFLKWCGCFGCDVFRTKWILGAQQKAVLQNRGNLTKGASL